MNEFDFEFEPVRLERVNSSGSMCSSIDELEPAKRLVVASEEEWIELKEWCHGKRFHVEYSTSGCGPVGPFQSYGKILIKAETLFGDANKGGIVDDQGRHCFEVDGESTKLSDIQNRLHEIIKDTQATVFFKIKGKSIPLRWIGCWIDLLQWVTFHEKIRRSQKATG